MRRTSQKKGKHGGKRPGAGRPAGKFRREAPHRSREHFERPSAIHVTIRCPSYISGLRCDRVFAAMRDVLARYTDGADFRVVHFSMQDNHLHMIVEASNSDVFELAMRGLMINAARALHAACNTWGCMFHRFHSTVIKTKRYARNAIAYVLGNWRRHTKHFHNGRILPDILDRYSSAISFDGWSCRFSIPADYKPLPVSAPRTYLLRSGWAFDGPLDPYAVPGPQR